MSPSAAEDSRCASRRLSLCLNKAAATLSPGARLRSHARTVLTLMVRGGMLAVVWVFSCVSVKLKCILLDASPLVFKAGPLSYVATACVPGKFSGIKTRFATAPLLLLFTASLIRAAESVHVSLGDGVTESLRPRVPRLRAPINTLAPRRIAPH